MTTSWIDENKPQKCIACGHPEHGANVCNSTARLFAKGPCLCGDADHRWEGADDRD